MSEHCPQDGGFIGDAGCTHPNHQHSDLVKSILSSSSNPHKISASDAESALIEGFYVKNQEKKNVAFGKKLLSHIKAHNESDANGRLAYLQFAVSAVEHPDKIEKNHRNHEGRVFYAKKFDKFGMIVISEPNKNTIDEIITIFPKRNMRGK